MIMFVIGFWAHPIGLFVIFVSKLSLPVVHYVLINLCCIMPFERYGAFERSWRGRGGRGRTNMVSGTAFWKRRLQRLQLTITNLISSEVLILPSQSSVIEGKQEI